jgi:hypothetical protein
MGCPVRVADRAQQLCGHVRVTCDGAIRIDAVSDQLAVDVGGDDLRVLGAPRRSRVGSRARSALPTGSIWSPRAPGARHCHRPGRRQRWEQRCNADVPSSDLFGSAGGAPWRCWDHNLQGAVCAAIARLTSRRRRTGGCACRTCNAVKASSDLLGSAPRSSAGNPANVTARPNRFTASRAGGCARRPRRSAQ